MNKPALAGTLSFIHPGLGQTYNGDHIKGIIFILIVFIGTVIEICSFPVVILLYIPL
jgi:TM2 domain-containing membrane protein YozV